WAPVPPPHAAARPVICHGAPVPTPHAAARPVNLPWAPVPPPHAAARPVILSWVPCTRSCCLPGPECVMGPCTASHCCCLPSPRSTMCHFQVSSHCWRVPFCHRVLADYGPPIAAARPVICHGPPSDSSCCC
ncbi:unnamed protein product, partial [Staurois parvus]